MSKHKSSQSHYIVSVYDDTDAPGVLRFTFVTKGLQQARKPGEPPKPVPQYIVSVQGNRENTMFTWLNRPPKESTKAELEAIARERVTERAAWIHRVSDLVKLVEGWAK